ncbi:hypothetical protein LSH36_344g01018 [Paralvinella palmiformis]|uniref:Glutaredoxin domain-containing protein n=1 Tax=Paralvinella palmiformis TaxID=53620 RepID=A0AAD9N1G5_9ANNE|nr:hypothetical protein LSH36_344g01018 [Paralvinella palmiformis]
MFVSHKLECCGSSRVHKASQLSFCRALQWPLCKPNANYRCLHSHLTCHAGAILEILASTTHAKTPGDTKVLIFMARINILSQIGSGWAIIDRAGVVSGLLNTTMAERVDKRVADNRRHITQHYTSTFPAMGTSIYYSAVNKKIPTSAPSTTSITSSTSSTPAPDKPRVVGSLTYRSSVSGVSDLRSIAVGRSTGNFWRGSTVNKTRNGPDRVDGKTPCIGGRSLFVDPVHSQQDSLAPRTATTCQISSKSRGPTESREYRDNVPHNTGPDGDNNRRGDGDDDDPNKCHHQDEINHAAHVDHSYRPSYRQTDGLTVDDKKGGSPGRGDSLNGTTTVSVCDNNTTSSRRNNSTNNSFNHNTPTALARDVIPAIQLGGEGEAEATNENIVGLRHSNQDPERENTDKVIASGKYTSTGRQGERSIQDKEPSLATGNASFISASEINKLDRYIPGDRRSRGTDDYESVLCEGAEVENQSSDTQIKSYTIQQSDMASRKKILTEPPVYENFASARPSPPTAPATGRPLVAPPIPPHKHNGHSQINKEAKQLPNNVQLRDMTGQNGMGEAGLSHTQHNNSNITGNIITSNISHQRAESEYSCNTETSSIMSDSLDSDRSSVVTDPGYRNFFQEKFYMNEHSSDDGEEKLGTSPSGLEHPLLITQRNILKPEEKKITKIISNRGTIRGLKNLVKAGIATYADRRDKNKNYRLLEAGKVVIYTTSVKIIRETHDRCLKVKKILQTHMISYEERDIFMSRKNHEELHDRLSSDHKEVPQVFADGQHIGGLEELENLNESGDLRRVFKQFRRVNRQTACIRCGGYQYIPCTICHGSKKSQNRNYFTEEFSALRCTHCDENGLIKCDMCANGEIMTS